MKSLFPLGNVVMTSGIAHRCEADPCFFRLVEQALNLHANGIWGDLCDEDWNSNQEALRTGEDRLFSAYQLSDATDERIWIITEWDHSVTTILFPDEY